MRIIIPLVSAFTLVASYTVVLDGQIYSQDLFWITVLTVCLCTLIIHALKNRRKVWILVVNFGLAFWTIAIIRAKAMDLPYAYEFQKSFNEAQEKSSMELRALEEIRENSAEQAGSNNVD